jgi:imidazolonepropionase-like amidohydrolase
MVRGAVSRSLALAIALAPPVDAQRAAGLAPDVRQYLSIDAPLVALTNVRVIDGTGGESRSGRTVVIEGERIRAVGPGGTVTIPAGARIVDLAGHTVIPGIVGLHDHMFYTTPSFTSVQSNYSFPRLYLGNGVTTVRTTGSNAPYTELTLRAGIERGEVPGPRIHITGPYLISPGPVRYEGMYELRDEEAARRVVRHWADEGAQWIKVYTQITRATFSAVVDEAHRHGLKVTGHLCSISFSEAVTLGIDNIEHGLRTNSDYDRSKEPDRCPASHFPTLAELDLNDARVAATIKLMVARGIPMTTTAVNEQLVPNRPGPDARTLSAMAPWIAEQELKRRANLDLPTPVGEIYPRMREIYPKSLQFERAFVKAGGILGAGVDPAFGALPGFGNQRALELLVEAGFEVVEAVRILTGNGARILGVQAERGTVEPGKLADLVVLRGDLGSDPRVIREPVLVFKGGLGYDSAALLASVKGQVGIR